MGISYLLGSRGTIMSSSLSWYLQEHIIGTILKKYNVFFITDYFDMVADVLKGDTLAPYLFIISLDYVLRTAIDKIKENGFKLTKERSRRYPAKTITDDIALLTNAPAHAETLLHSLERAAAGIGLHVNAPRRNICALIKQVKSPHKTVSLWN